MSLPVYEAMKAAEPIVKLIALLQAVEPSLEEGEILILGPGIPRLMVKHAIDNDSCEGPLASNWAKTTAWMESLESDLRAAIGPVIATRLKELEGLIRGPLWEACMDDGPEGRAP